MPPLSERKLKKIRSKFGIILMAAIIFGGVFCYLGGIKQANALGTIVNYQKTASGTLMSSEWNDLFSDFVNTFSQASMVGPLGIGRTPGVPLDVNGYFRATAVNISAIGSGIIMADSSGNLYSTSSVIATGIPLPTGLSGYTLRSDGTSWLTSALLFNDGTNIGIGKTNPTVGLDVHGSISADGNVSGTGLCIGSDCKVSWPAIIAAGGGNLWSGTTTGAIYNANGVYNVGIGTSAPGAKLHITGATPQRNLQISDAGLATFNYWDTAGNTRFLTFTNAYGNLAVTNDILWRSGRAGTGLYDSAMLRIGNEQDWTATTATNDSYIALHATLDGTMSEKLRITSAGNVGIGTTAPVSKLDVNGSFRVMGNLPAPTSGAGIEMLYNGSSLAYIYAYDRTTPGYKDLQLGNGPQVYLKNDGNVGIGATAPGTLLDVNGFFRATAAAISAIGSGIIMADSAGNLYSTSTTVATGIPSPAGISGQTLRSNGTSWVANNLLFNTGTNIGIGTTNPGNKLNLVGTDDKDLGPIFSLAGSAANQTESGRLRFTEVDITASPYYQGAFIHYNGSANALNIGVHNNADALTASDVNAISIQRSTANINLGGNALYVQNAGNVGVGKTNPAANLDVSTNISAGSTVTGTGICIGASCITNWPWLKNSTHAYFNDTGNVGIGTSSPAFKLDVAGVINATALYVNGSPYIGSQWITQGSHIYYSAGNVGIGVTAPTVKLDNNGSFKSSLITTLSALGSGLGTNTLVMADTNGVLFSTSTAAVITANGLWSGTKNGAIWNGDSGVGNVGVGTTNPNGLLELRKGNGSGVGPELILDNPLYTYGIESAISFRNSGGVKARIKNTITTDANGSGNIIFETQNNVPALGERMRIASDGNVGIGTTAPGLNLEIAKAQDGLTGFLLNNAGPGTSARTGFQFTEGGAAVGWVQHLNSTNSVQTGGANAFQVWNSVNGKILFATSNTPRLAISGAGGLSLGSTYYNTDAGANNLIVEGNVGVGITAPTVKLDNTGSFKTSLFATISSLGSGLGTNSVVMVDTNGGLFSTSTSNFAGGTNFWGGTKNANIWNGDAGVGNVGIGLTNPDGKLHIDSDSTAQDVLTLASNFPAFGNLATNIVFQDSATEAAKIGAFHEGAYQVGLSFQTLHASAQLTEKVRINAAGNVGIGTTNPVTKLQISQTAVASTRESLFKGTVSDAGNDAFYIVNGTSADGRFAPTFSGYVDSSNIPYSINFRGMTSAANDASDSSAVGLINFEAMRTDSVSDPNNGNMTAIQNRKLLTVTNNSTNLFTILAGGNVGIGNATPLYPLSVKGTSGQDTALHLWQNGIGAGTIGLKASDNKIYISNTLGGTADFGAASKSITLDTYGNVGIGKTNPAVNLDVNGAINSGSTVNGTSLCIAGDCKTAWSQVTGSGTSYWALSGSNLYASSTAYNVGIGTTAPGAALEVSKAVVSGPTMIINRVDSTHQGFISLMTGATQEFFMGTPANLSNMFIFGSGSGGSVSASLAGFKTNGFHLADYATAQNTPNAWLDVEPPAGITNGLIVRSGNVGIGTTNPIGTSANGFTQNANSRGLELRSGSDAGYGNLYLRSFGGTVGLDITVDPVSTGAVFFDSRYSAGPVGSQAFRFRTETNGTAVEALAILDHGNVGIGKTNPTTNLDVLTSINGGSTVNGTSLCIAGDCRTSWGGAAGWTVNGTEVYKTNTSGNVGIGTTNPTAKLHVDNTIRVGVPDVSDGNIITGNSLLFNVDSDNNSIGEAFIFGTNRVAGTGGTELMRISETGNVGIGTTNPSGLLELRQGNGSGIGPELILDNPLYTYGIESAISFRNSGGVKARIKNTITTDANGSGNIIFETQNNVPALGERMRITSDGNVGINITNPTYKLQVVGTSYLNGQITTSLSGSGNRCIYVDASGNLLAKTADCGTASGGDNMGDHIATQNIRLGSNWLSGDGGNEGIFVKADGNVGVGTTNPGYKLEVSGTGYFSGDFTASRVFSSGTTALVQSYSASGGSALLRAYSGVNYWDFGVSTTAGGNRLFIGPGVDSSVANAKLTIDSTGNVGVGKTNPAVNLDVNGAISGGSTINGTSLCIAGDCRTSWGGAAGWTVNGTEVYKTNTSGNVGIGVTAPGAKLDINGNAIIGAAANTGTTIPLRINGLSVSDGANPYGNYAGILFDADSSYTASARRHLITNALGVNKFGIIRSVDALTDPALGTSGVVTSGTADFVIDNAGNVGINQISPTAKLQVSGGGIDAGGTVNGTGLCIAGDCRVSWPAVVAAGGGNLWSGTTTGAIYSANGANNVGIGIVGPLAKLDVFTPNSTLPTGPITTRTDLVGIKLGDRGAGGVNTKVALWADLGNIQSGLVFGREGTQWGSFVAIHTRPDNVSSLDDFTERVRINNLGNVGIGITNPAHKLSVAGTSYLNGQITTSLSGSGNRCIYVDASGNLLAKTTDCGTATGGDNLGDHTATQNIKLGNYWLSGDGGAEGVFVKADGNVGVGTSNPAPGLLTIRKDGTTAAALTLINNNGTNLKYSEVRSQYSETDVSFSSGIRFIQDRTGVNYGSSIGFLTEIDQPSQDYNYAMYIRNRNVGVGKTNPAVNLDVNGAINSGSTVNGTSLCIANDCRTSWGGAAGWTVNGTEVYKSNTAGNVGIGVTAPLYRFTVQNDDGVVSGLHFISGFQRSAGSDAQILIGYAANGSVVTTPYLYSANSQPLAFYTGGANRLHIAAGGNVGVGTTNPGTLLDVNGYFRATAATLSAMGAGIVMSNSSGVLYSTSSVMAIGGPYLALSGDTMTGPINMGDNNITNVADMTVNHKLTVYTIDPLYKIKGTNYSTYAASISGGVKEEYVGKINISTKVPASQEYEAIIDFADIKAGSDLWVWREVVEFNKEAIDIAITPYGGFAQVYYLIEDNKLIFRADRPIEVSYRLIAKRFDWRDWPTRALDQTIQGVEVKR